MPSSGVYCPSLQLFCFHFQGVFVLSILKRSPLTGREEITKCSQQCKLWWKSRNKGKKTQMSTDCVPLSLHVWADRWCTAAVFRDGVELITHCAYSTLPLLVSMFPLPAVDVESCEGNTARWRQQQQSDEDLTKDRILCYLGLTLMKPQVQLITAFTC